MVTRSTCWLAYGMNPPKHMLRYQQQILNWITRLFLKYFVFPNAILLDNWKMIRDGMMKLKMIEDDVEHNRIMAEFLVYTGVPLRLVVNWATPQIVRMMLDMVVKPNDPCHDSVNTALHAAVQKGDCKLETARMLLDCGAEVDAVDQDGYTPLQRTLQLRYPILWMVKLLVSKGAKVDSLANNLNETPLLTAVSFNQPLSVVKFLVEHGANPIKERTRKGRETVLHRASVHQRCDLIDYFLHHGMNVDVKSKSGLNLVSHKVVQDCEPEFFEFLISRNAVVDTIMESRPSNIKHLESKVRLYILYARMKMNRSLYEINWTLLPHFDFHSMLPILELSALQDFLWNIKDWPLLEEELYLSNRLRKYLHDCKKELQRMKDEKLYGEVTLLNLLADDMKKVRRYLGNRRIVKSLLLETDLKKRYPIYSAYFEPIRRLFNEQYELEEETAARLAQLQGLNPHDLCVRKIVTFLASQDMRKFLSCFEYVSKSDE